MLAFLLTCLLACVLVFALHALALERVPLAAYGTDGAELLPHLQRLHATTALEKLGSGPPGLPVGLLRSLDGQYPPLLPLLAAFSGQLLSVHPHNFAFFAHLNILPLGLLALSLLGLSRPPPEPGSHAPAPGGEGDPPAPSFSLRKRQPLTTWPVPALLALIPLTLVVLTPGLMMPARRFYYDLPMVATLGAAALCLLGGRGLLSPTRALLGGLAVAATLLIRWAGALYLLPIGLLALGLAWRRERWRGLKTVPAALLTPLLLCLPLALKPEGSFQFQRHLGMQAGQGWSSVLEAAGFYANAWWTAGLGPLLSAALLPAMLLLGRAPAGRRQLLIAASLVLPPLLWLHWMVPARDGRYLMPFLPVALWLLVRGGQTLKPSHHSRWGWLLLALAVLQLPWAEGQPSSTLESQHWRRWWWSGLVADRPSSWSQLEPLAAHALEKSPGARVLLLSPDRAPTLVYAWQYAMETLRPGTGALLATPSAPSPEAWVTLLERDVDLLVISSRHPVGPLRSADLRACYCQVNPCAQPAAQDQSEQAWETGLEHLTRTFTRLPPPGPISTGLDGTLHLALFVRGAL